MLRYTVFAPWLFMCALGAAQDLELVRSTSGNFGGRLIIAQRVEPKTLNPVVAVDAPSRDVIRRMMGDLITINRETQNTAPGLAKSWQVSSDGRLYTVQLRSGLQFSDGHPFNADDVLFTFRVYLDEKIASPNRDLLIISGKPIEIEKVSPTAVRLRLPQPYAAAERLFDSIAILPRHLLEKDYLKGTLLQAWGVHAAPGAIAGLGPFRLQQYLPGDRIILERNPYYWKKHPSGQRLPFLDELVFRFLANEDAQILRLASRDVDVTSRLSARNFAALARDAEKLDLRDLGPSLESNFLFFNLGQPAPARAAWMRNEDFRQAVSSAIDRDAMARLIYLGKATPIAGTVSPGNRRWKNATLEAGKRDLNRSRSLLQQAGFVWKNGKLSDPAGAAVEFTIIVSSSNSERAEMAAMIQHDLADLGITVRVAALEFRSLLDRVLRSKEYDACIFGVGGGDADPNAEMSMLLSHGNLHLWNLNPGSHIDGWEQELDRLMTAQLTETRYPARKQLYDRAQALVVRHLPVIGLLSPNVLIAARKGLGNLRPAVMDHHTLWNAEYLFWKEPTGKRD